MPRSRVPAISVPSDLSSVMPICTSRSAQMRSSASARAASPAMSGVFNAAGIAAATSLTGRTKASSSGAVAAPERLARSRHAAISENSPAVSDLSNCQGRPGPRRPNQRNG